jgi:hypothetical protein
MISTQVILPEALDQWLVSLAKSQGLDKQDLIRKAVEAYVHAPLTAEEMMARRRSAFGIWKNRDDLPNFASIRLSFDRKLNWDEHSNDPE